jgi:hypothetical protein
METISYEEKIFWKGAHKLDTLLSNSDQPFPIVLRDECLDYAFSEDCRGC